MLTPILLASFLPIAQLAPSRKSPLDGLKVRDGYTLTIAVDNIPDARFLEVGDDGTLYVSRPFGHRARSDGKGDITSFKESNGSYGPPVKYVAGYANLHGLFFEKGKEGEKGWLWFTTSDSVYRARDIDGDGQADEVVEVLGKSQLPGGGMHWWRPILVTGEHFYTAIGDSGNINDETASDRQKIWRFNRDGSGKSLFASGIRNTEKLRLRPGTSEVWGCDHGSDHFGKEAVAIAGGTIGEKEGESQPITDLHPPDELNRYIEGGFYGHPFVTGNKLPRYEYLKRPDIIELAKKAIAPEWCFGAHWAVNGFCFVDPEINNRTHALPKDHNGDLFAACHGSWNSTEPVGYCIARVLFDDGKPYGLLTIVSGYNPTTREQWSRPVDCCQAPDGSILWSCDMTGKVYRLRSAK